MCEFIFFVFLVIVSGVTCVPKIQVHTTTYDNTFKNLDTQLFPYNAVDVHPPLGRIAFLIVGANDFTAITKNDTLQAEYRDLEDKIRYTHGAHLALIGCDGFGPRDLNMVDDFIKASDNRKIRTFGYGIFNTNYTIKDNRWDDDSVDLLLNEFMKKIHGDKYERHEFPDEYVSIFDPNPSAGRLQSTRVNTINGRFESKIVVTFILFGGDQMDKFLKSNHHKEHLMQIVANDFHPFGLVFLLGCYNFRNHFYLIADVIEHEKARLVEKYRGPMPKDNIHVYVQGRGIWSSDFVYINKPTMKLIPNVDYPALDPFLDLYYEKTLKHTEYSVYDCNLNYIKQLGFEYVNGRYRSHAADDSFKFDNSAKVIKVIFTTKAQFDSVCTSGSKLSMLKQALKDAQPTNHKIYLVVCHAEISTYPNVIVSMLESHMGNYMKKQLGEVWLNTPKTIGTIQRNGDGGRYKELSYKPIDDILAIP